MKQYSLPDRKITWAGICALFLGVLFLNRDALYSGTILGFYKAQFLMLACMAAGGLGFLICRRKDWKALLTDPRVLFALAAGAVILFPMLVKRDWQLMYFSIWLAVIFSVFVSLFLSLEDAAKIYLKILCVLGVVSLVCAYGLRLLPDRGLLRLPVVTNDSDVEFYFFGLSFVPLTFVKYRNFGIFREPGVYQYFLLLGLFLNSYEVKWDEPWKYWTVNILLALTMVSTFATGGLVELALFALVLFFDRGWHREKAGKLAAAGVLLLGICAAAYVFICKGPIYDTVMDMLSKFTMASESLGDRVGSIVENTKTFLRNPLVGGRVKDTLYAVDNNTSSSTALYAILGILGGTLNAAAWVALSWRRGGKIWVSVSLTVILFMSFNTENLITDPFFWLFPVMAVCQRVLPAVIAGRKREDHSADTSMDH